MTKQKEGFGRGGGGVTGGGVEVLSMLFYLQVVCNNNIPTVGNEMSRVPERIYGHVSKIS